MGEVTAGLSNTIGANNDFFGNAAGEFNTTGNANAFFGDNAGMSNTTGSRNTIIGNDADVGSGSLANATAIGDRAFVSANNSLVLGSINGVNTASADTKVGIGTTAPTFHLHIKDPSNQGFRVETNTTGGTLASFGGFGAFQIDSSGTPGGRLTILENGNVSINSSSPPTDKLYVNGDVRVNGVVRVPGGSVYIANPNTLIITSPNGACWGITVSNTGVVSAFSTTCP